MIHISNIRNYLENVPLTNTDLVRCIKDASDEASLTHRSIHLTWAGAYELLVHPNRTFSLLPIMFLKQYKLSGDEHIEEVM